jgi:hypothetical protein
MRSLVYISWFGSTVIQIFLVFLIFRRGVHKRFSFFCAYVLYDLIRAIAVPAAAALIKIPHLYFYLYWLSLPVEYIITFLLIIQVFAHIFRVHILDSSKPIRLFLLSVLVLFALSAVLVLVPDIPANTSTGLILLLDRSTELLICGLLIFMWVYSARLGLSFQNHVWGIVFGLGIYSAVSLISAAINAALGDICTGLISSLPHFAYFGSVIIWAVYLARPEPGSPPLTDQRLTEYWNLIDTCKAALAAVRKALR